MWYESSLNHAVNAWARLIFLHVEWHFDAHYKHFMLPEKNIGGAYCRRYVRPSVRSSIRAQIS
jgi:hypothetical protein